MSISVSEAVDTDFIARFVPEELASGLPLVKVIIVKSPPDLVALSTSIIKCLLSLPSIASDIFKFGFWVNYREDDSDLSSEAQTQYLAFQDQFKALSLDNVYLEMALDKLDNPGQNISIARSNNMSAILADIASSRFGLDHQIMWLDADTTFLSPNFFSGVSQSLIDRPTQFVHPDLEYSLEWLSQDSQEWDQASKVLLIDEMARRVSKQVKLKSKKRPYYGNSRNELSDRLYPEESGLAFTVLTYLMSGGFLLNEGQGSYCLRRGIASWRIMYGHYPNVQNALHQQFENLRPSTISGDYVYWDDDSLIRLSARRIYLELCTHGLMALQTQRSASAEENYQLYSQRDQEAATHSPRFNPDLVFFYLRGRYFDKSGKAKEPGAEEACNHIARMMLNKNLELG